MSHTVSKDEFTAYALLHILRREPDFPLFLGLFVTEVVPARTPDLPHTTRTIEVHDPQYERSLIQLAIEDEFFAVNKNEIFFPEASKTWGTVTHSGIFDAQKHGNLIHYKQIPPLIMQANEKAYMGIKDFCLYVGTLP